MSKAISILFFIGLFTSCTAVKPIENTEKWVIEHNFQNVEFTPISVAKEISDNIEIVILPLDAISLNKKAHNLAVGDGSYEKEAITYRNPEQEKMVNNSRMTKESALKAVNVIKVKVDEGDLHRDVGEAMISRLLYDPGTGNNGIEIERKLAVENYFSKSNPYRVNDRYLTVFKLDFNNHSSEVQEILFDNFQVTSGAELLYPLKNSYFEKNFNEDSDKLRNAYRLNMPEKLRLTPGQRIEKYFAVPAINPAHDILQVQYIDNNEVVNFDFKVSFIHLKKVYHRFKLKSATLDVSRTKDIFFVAKVGSGDPFALKNDIVYIDNEEKSELVSVYGIEITKTGEIFFGKSENFKLAESSSAPILIRLTKVE